MGDQVQRYEGKEIIVYFEGARCIHSANCVNGLPTVFKANVPGPWIDPDAVDAQALARLIETCPSGALRYERKDDVANEVAPSTNTITVMADGPLDVRADLNINQVKASSPRATLCRCGASKNKPYCDNSHQQTGFKETGRPAVGDVAHTLPSGPLEITTPGDGPLLVSGPLEIHDSQGQVVCRTEQAALCRCGTSQNKPYCDGSHVAAGFEAP
jgi:CDGSH-type Zn-finger protein/uncharacterized Fe-S cluster protein YjdI